MFYLLYLYDNEWNVVIMFFFKFLKELFKKKN